MSDSATNTNYPTPTARDPEAMIAAAKEMERRYLAAYNQGDLEGCMANYWHSPHLTTFPADVTELRGYDAVLESTRNGLAAAPGAVLETMDQHHVAAGDVVIAWGKWRMTMPGEKAEVFEGRYTSVIGERDGRWVYLLDHTSMVVS